MIVELINQHLYALGVELHSTSWSRQHKEEMHAMQFVSMLIGCLLTPYLSSQNVAKLAQQDTLPPLATLNLVPHAM